MTSKNETTEEEMKVTRVPSGVITTRSTATADAPVTALTARSLAPKEPEEVYPEDDDSSSSESSSSEIVASSSYQSQASLLRANSSNIQNIVSQTSLITPVTSPRIDSSSANNTPRGQQESSSSQTSGSGSSSSSPSNSNQSS